MMSCERLLIPVDFSAEAALAMEWAVKLAEEGNAPLIYLLHVLPFADSAYQLRWTEDLVGMRSDVAERNLTMWQEKLPKDIPSIALLRKGAVAEEISRFCKEKAIDLVILSTHERRNHSRAQRPTVCEETVRLAGCPVLVLHLNKKTAALAALR